VAVHAAGKVQHEDIRIGRAALPDVIGDNHLRFGIEGGPRPHIAVADITLDEYMSVCERNVASTATQNPKRPGAEE
jgi:hypothetical protein